MIVATYNVHKCVGTDGCFDPARVTAVIKETQASVVAVQEADRRFGRKVGLLDIAGLHDRCNLRPVMVADIPDGHGFHGNALLVRNGIKVVGTPMRMSLPGIEPRGMIVVELDTQQGMLRVVCAHLGLIGMCRKRQGMEILSVMGQRPAMPTLIMGDMNEPRSKGSALGVLAPMFGKPSPVASFPSRMPIMSLDRILGWPRDMVLTVQAHDSGKARAASDHLPVVAEVRFPENVAWTGLSP